jgi:hypothetical protein
METGSVMLHGQFILALVEQQFKPVSPPGSGKQ